MVRILFIDDDQQMLNLMDKVSQLLGFEAVLCPSSNEGLEKAIITNANIIIVDMQMHEIDGITLVKKLRKESALARTPILLLSAERDNKLEILAKEAGADGYYLKPLGFEEMETIITKFAGKPQQQP